MAFSLLWWLAEHLDVPVPANAPEIIASLDAWHQQLKTRASE
jgi:hypothetical protein